LRRKRREQKRREIKGEEIYKGEESQRTRKVKEEDRLGARKRREKQEKGSRKEIYGTVDRQASGKQGEKQGR